ncbi:putative F-box domain-containing protein [Tanacetum coccineum]
MSDHIPLDVQMEIIKRLPVISLLKFRSVSKTWKSLIDNSDHFIQPQHMLIGYTDPVDHKKKYISVVDDYTFPQHTSATTGPYLFEVLLDYQLRFVGSSSGLVCFFAEYPSMSGLFVNRIGMAVTWNPCIKKSIAIHVPMFSDFGGVNLGFGVCPKTNDIVLVNVYHPDMDGFNHQADIFKLSAGVWRPFGNPPGKAKEFIPKSVSLDGFIYWHSYDHIVMDGRSITYHLIMSFDMTSEEFTEVHLPHDLAYHGSLSLSKSLESLVVIQQFIKAGNCSCVVWMMNHGDSVSFTKLFNINTPCGSLYGVLGFKRNGEPIIKKKVDDCKTSVTLEDCEPSSVTLEVYEPSSKQTNALGIRAKSRSSSFVCFYRETPMLLDQTDGSIYAENWWEVSSHQV